jgi:hypothetical protein
MMLGPIQQQSDAWHGQWTRPKKEYKSTSAALQLQASASAHTLTQISIRLETLSAKYILMHGRVCILVSSSARD